jgi:hypothetical protein
MALKIERSAGAVAQKKLVFDIIFSEAIVARSFSRAGSQSDPIFSGV